VRRRLGRSVQPLVVGFENKLSVLAIVRLPDILSHAAVNWFARLVELDELFRSETFQSCTDAENGQMVGDHEHTLPTVLTNEGGEHAPDTAPNVSNRFTLRVLVPVVTLQLFQFSLLGVEGMEDAPVVIHDSEPMLLFANSVIFDPRNHLQLPPALSQEVHRFPRSQVRGVDNDVRKRGACLKELGASDGRLYFSFRSKWCFIVTNSKRIFFLDSLRQFPGFFIDESLSVYFLKLAVEWVLLLFRSQGIVRGLAMANQRERGGPLHGLLLLVGFV